MQLLKVVNVLLLLISIALLPHDCMCYSISQIELHHVFPQAFSGFFLARGINPNLYCIPLTREKHTGPGNISIHHKKYVVSGGMDYNGSWRLYFIPKNPRATKEQCFTFAAMLLAEYGITLSAITFYDYITKKPSGSTFPQNSNFKKILNSLSKLSNKFGKLGNVIPFIIIAYEVYSFAAEFDDDFNCEYADKALDKMIRANDYFNNNECNKALEKIAAAKYFLGMFIYENIIRYAQSMYGAIASNFDSEREYKIDFAIRLFKDVCVINKKLNDTFPDATMRLALVYLMKNDKHNGRKYLLEARSEYNSIGDYRKVAFIDKTLSNIGD